MSLLSSLLYLFLLIVSEIIYFKIAKANNIVDKPNERSSHKKITIRGGGIIFSVGTLFWWAVNGLPFPFFITGLSILTVISFIDDIYSVKRRYRLGLHFIAVVLLLIQWDLFSMNWYVLPVAIIFIIATINAYNFMDGINGILGAYSLVVLGSLYYIDNYMVDFTNENLIIVSILAVLVFNFFNFRTRAKCFAGDVGSVSMAFLVVFLVGQLILTTGNLAFVFLLLIYGLDTSITVLFRVIRKENIVEAHRTHFYQYLANERNWSHLTVSVLYAIVQLAVSVIVLYFINLKSILPILGVVAGTTLIYVMLRIYMEGTVKLFRRATDF